MWERGNIGHCRPGRSRSADVGRCRPTLVDIGQGRMGPPVRARGGGTDRPRSADVGRYQLMRANVGQRRPILAKVGYKQPWEHRAVGQTRSKMALLFRGLPGISIAGHVGSRRPMPASVSQCGEGNIGHRWPRREADRRNVGHCRPGRSRSADVGRCRPTLVDIGQGQMRPQGRAGAGVPDWPMSADVGRYRLTPTNVGQCRPTLANA